MVTISVNHSGQAPAINSKSVWKQAVSSIPQVQKGLLVLATIAAATISLVPHLRGVGSLAARSIALVSTSLNCIDGTKQSETTGLKCAKVGQTALGLIGVATSLPCLISASLAAHAAYTTFEMSKDIRNGECNNAAIKFTAIVIDCLTLSAIATASWQLMLAAVVVNAIAMAGFAAYSFYSAKSGGDILEALCYTILAGLSIATAVSVTKLADVTKPSFKNTTDKPIKLYQWVHDADNEWGPIYFTCIGEVQPGETFDLSQVRTGHWETGQGWVIFEGNNGAWTIPDNDPYGKNATTVPVTNVTTNNHTSRMSFFPALPIGGNAIAAPIINVINREKELEARRVAFLSLTCEGKPLDLLPSELSESILKYL